MDRSHLAWKTGLLATFVLGHLALSGIAGHRIEAEIKDYTASSPVTYRARVLFTPADVKINATSPSDRRSEIIYNARRDILRRVNHKEKNYQEMDIKTVGDLGETFKSAVAAVRKSMAGLARENAPETATRLNVVATDDVQRLCGLPIRRFAVQSGKTKIQDVWIATWGQTGLKREDFGAVERLARSYERILSVSETGPVFQGLEYIPLRGILRIDGFPLLVRHYKKNRLTYEIRFSLPVPAKVSATDFQLPGGYTRRWL